MTAWNQIVSLTMALIALAANLNMGCVDGMEASPAPAPGEEAVIQAPILLLPEAPEELIEENARAAVDYSNTEDGYVMVFFSAVTDKRLKVRVTGPSTQYTYDLTQGEWETFPLSDGNGKYQVSVYENLEGTSYRNVLTARFEAELSSPLAPFLRPNQYVNYVDAPRTLEKAAELTAGLTDPAAKVGKIYEYVINALEYDREKAKSVESGYLPELDKVLSGGKGICFDYAALMSAMLRSQGIPCRLVVGYAGKAYHAWVEVWTEHGGKATGEITLRAGTWERMDPTFASSGGGEEIEAYIGDGSHYTPVYYY